MKDTKYAVIMVTKGENDVIALPKEQIKDSWKEALDRFNELREELEIVDKRKHKEGQPISIETFTHHLELWVIHSQPKYQPHVDYRAE